MIVCLCHRVSDRSIETEVRRGCRSFEALQDELCVGNACGACETCARQTFDDASARQAQCAPAASAIRTFPIYVAHQLPTQRTAQRAEHAL